VHAELPGPIDAALPTLSGDRRSYQRYLASRPPAAEDEAIDLVYRSCIRSGARAHIVHLSSAGGLDRLRRARDAGVRLTAETTPHYLHFEAESIPDGAPEFKCAPPIREHANREQLWQAIGEELLAGVVSDHSPCTPELKKLQEGDVERAWGGIASLQFGLSVVWTNARRRGVGIERISILMSEGPARIAGLDDRKGRLQAEFDADLVVWAPDETFRVLPEGVQHRHKVTPYAGAELHGVVKATWLRGAKVWDDGEPVGDVRGSWLR
jgi:allantoinase